MLEVSAFPHWFLAGVAVMLGLTFGSFLNVVVYRLPRGESVAFPASRCPACGAAIRPWDNVPVLSWVLLRGRARCCGARISPRYLLLEVLGGLLAWAVLERMLLELPLHTPVWEAALVFSSYLLLGLGLLAAIFIDLEHMLLPDEITLGGAALGLLTVPFREISLGGALTGGAVGFCIVWLPFILLYRALRGQAGMGLGDAKLLLLSGVWFGWKGAVFALMAGAVQGTLVALVVFLVKGKIEEPEAVKEERAALREELAGLEGEERARLEAELSLDPLAQEPGSGLAQARLAFGPFLAMATLQYLFFGEWLVGKYVAFLWLA